MLEQLKRIGTGLASIAGALVLVAILTAFVELIGHPAAYTILIILVTLFVAWLIGYLFREWGPSQ